MPGAGLSALAVAISVVIPVLHEQERIGRLIQLLKGQGAGVKGQDFWKLEIIVVDGDPDGSTINVITDPTVVRLTAPQGRGMQLAAGAALASGETILMLHADTELPANGLGLIVDAAKQGTCWGAFRLGIAGRGIGYRVIERMVDIRCRLFSLPYGDQAVFVTRSRLEQAGGIPQIPLMEDVALARSLMQHCGPCKLLPLRVQTSPRRWQKDGILKRTVKNWWLLARYLSGADPADLTKEYE